MPLNPAFTVDIIHDLLAQYCVVFETRIQNLVFYSHARRTILRRRLLFSLIAAAIVVPLLVASMWAKLVVGEEPFDLTHARSFGVL